MDAEQSHNGRKDEVNVMFDDGIITIYTLENTTSPGSMPVEKLVLFKQFYFAYRMVGYSRQFAARGVNEKIDEMVRIWQDRAVRIGMYAIIDGVQYRISDIQQLYDETGLGVTDITLVRLGEDYDINPPT